MPCAVISIGIPGLSPRVRGNPIWAFPYPPSRRSIPACAGEPCSLQVLLTVRMVYPRVCGGTYACKADRFCANGLSPRVRGNQRATRKAMQRVRSIPACAGEPTTHRECRNTKEVYPRVCGGTDASRNASNEIVGLSPRVRGNPIVLLGQAIHPGSIPACAGEPVKAAIRIAIKEVYPRVCGGTMRRCLERQSAHGLSPRVRGNRRQNIRTTASRRSIPACAGEPSMCPHQSRAR